MSRINTNVGALVAQRNLATANKDMQVRLQRLSTGLAINRGADDPAGLIVSERLRSEMSGVRQAIDNAERASNVIATAEAALAEISNLLADMKGLVVQAANTGGFSPAEIQANQLQIDSSIESINRIASSTSFAGMKLLNGSLDYIVSGRNTSEITDLSIFGASFGTQSSMPVNVEVLNSAQQASLFLSGNTAGAPGALLSSVAFEVIGPRGSEVFEFVSGTPLSAVAFAVNQVSDATGITAGLVSATDQTSGLTFTSDAYGSDSFVSIRKISDGAFFDTFGEKGDANTQAIRATGEDVLGLVNGNLALGKGTTLSLRTSTLNLELTLGVNAAQTLSTYSFDIQGGGADFQIGPTVDSAQRVGFGIHSVSTSHLGNAELGFLNSIKSGGDNSLIADGMRDASLIIDQSINQIANLRGRMGAFERNTLQTAARSQAIALENLTASESQIRDADFAAETSALTRAQILTQAGTSTLALANNTSSNVLSLLQ